MVLHIFAHNFLNVQLIFNPKKVLESWDLGLFNHTIITMNNLSKAVYVKGVEDMSTIALCWGVYPLNYTVDPKMKSSNYNKFD